MFRFRRYRKPTEGAAARVRAEIQLEKTKRQTPMHEALGTRLHDLRERNHLAEAFQQMFGEGKA